MNEAPASSAALAELAQNYWDTLMELNPTWATALGDHRFDDRLPEHGPAARERHHTVMSALRARCGGISPDDLSQGERVTLEILTATLDLTLQGHRFPDERWALSPLTGTQVWTTDLASHQPVGTPEQLDALVSRFEQIPRLLEGERTSLTEGVLHHQVPYHTTVERVVAQIRRLTEHPAAESPFIRFRDEGLDPAWREKVHRRLSTVIDGTVLPSMRGFADFLAASILPHARQTPGLASIPDGLGYYHFLVSYYTDFPGTPEDIHHVGREELGRIHEEMKEIASRLGGDASDLRAFAETLHERPELFPTSREHLVEFNRQVLERAHAALPRVFSRLPSRPVEVKPIDAFREADSPSGYYTRAPEGGARSATYYVNTYRANRRPLFNMEALAFHEAVPGHHLQIGLAQELTDLPQFRRHTGQTAFIEGWALYAERLADELGLYSSDVARFGMLSYQAWRASRLVVDTGLHAMGWSREQGIQFLFQNTAHSHNEAVVEVDRYITMPGQALAYMIGRLAIDDLRRMAQARLGSQFDLREFHSRVLENGAVPLAVLRKLIQRWLEPSEQPAA